jgi:hypothetical protein
VTPIRSVRAAGALLLAALAAGCAPAPGADLQNVAARWTYEGPPPPQCDARKTREARHHKGDGHAAGHEHLGHGHEWKTRNFKGYAIKPPCVVRRVSGLGGRLSTFPALPIAGVTAATRNALSGDMS